MARDPEDRRHAAEEVGVDDREHAQREEHRPGQRAEDGEQQREDEDEDLRDQEDLAVEPEGVRDLRERVAKGAPVEERPPDFRPPGRVRDGDADEDDEDDRADERDGDAPAAVPAGAHAVEDARAPPDRYFRTGAPVDFASHCCWSFFSVPFDRSRLSAWLTQPASGLPFANTIPK